ncbi:hypothetical protein ACFIOY_29270 [Bradyrhizobium sp. TZ2]
MSDFRRRWSEDDIANLKSMAGKRPAKEIAAELGFTATMAEASKLKISLRVRPYTARPATVQVGHPAGHESSD